MIKLKNFCLMSLLVMSVGFFGCNDDSNPVGNGTGGGGNSSSHVDTSKFVGTWIRVFDTSDVTPGTKEDKLWYWDCYDGECGSPKPFFYNDSITQSLYSLLYLYYRYDDDSIYYYSKTIGTNDYDLESMNAYTLVNDTLYEEPETTYVGGIMRIIYPVYVRTTTSYPEARIGW